MLPIGKIELREAESQPQLLNTLGNVFKLKFLITESGNGLIFLKLKTGIIFLVFSFKKIKSLPDSVIKNLHDSLQRNRLQHDVKDNQTIVSKNP